MWQFSKTLQAVVTLLSALLTEMRSLRADIQRNTTMSDTVTKTLAEALGDEHEASQMLLAANATQQATIASLNKQAQDKDRELATAKANAATPEQIAELEADALALRTAAQVVAQPPAVTPTQTTPDPTTATQTPTSGSTTLDSSPISAASTTAEAGTPETSTPPPNASVNATQNAGA